MKRAPTGNEPKRPSRASAELSSSPRLAAAGSQAIEAHARVRWLAERLGEELEDAPPDGAPPEDLDPSDSVVVAVEKATTTMKSVTASMAAVSGSSPSLSLPSTKLGIGAPAGKPPIVKTKLGIGTGSRNNPKKSDADDTETDE